LQSIYCFHEKDYKALLVALQEGKLSLNGRKYLIQEIEDMKVTSVFKNRYSKYLRKQVLPAATMEANLEQWFNCFKVTSSSTLPEVAPQGRLDPQNGKCLFTPDTKGVLTEQLNHIEHIQDPLPTEAMYCEIRPSKFSRHGLTEYISMRCESKVEGLHNPLSHFGNLCMRATLCDALNLAGTTRYNVAICLCQIIQKCHLLGSLFPAISTVCN